MWGVGRVKTWSRIREITADEKDEVDFAGSMVRPKGKTVYFLSLIV
jgi:hypothetical protein